MVSGGNKPRALPLGWYERRLWRQRAGRGGTHQAFLHEGAYLGHFDYFTEDGLPFAFLRARSRANQGRPLGVSSTL